MTALTRLTRRLTRRAPTVLWLLAVWLLLWWELTVPMVLFGIAVAVAVVLVFPLPDVTERIVVRPIPLLLLIGYVLGDVALSAVRTGWDALVAGKRVRSAIVAVELLGESDATTAIAASLLTLSPGTFVVQINRAQRRYYVHALSTASSADVAKVRTTARRLQRLVLRTFDPRREITEGMRR